MCGVIPSFPTTSWQTQGQLYKMAAGHCAPWKYTKVMFLVQFIEFLRVSDHLPAGKKEK
jgi:hypothetical protein